MAVDMENKKLELKIPEKVSDHQYVIQGIGKHEMTILVIQFLAAIGLLLICAISEILQSGYLLELQS